uniref:Uncharacterized protein n=1 Tax=Rhizophagus irregularis (strain DAOM 181602 / DAOM 197198 / MUCL 43194) TaxID=747089 RepID=U9UG30_RHIID
MSEALYSLRSKLFIRELFEEMEFPSQMAGLIESSGRLCEHQLCSQKDNAVRICMCLKS